MHIKARIVLLFFLPFIAAHSWAAPVQGGKKINHVVLITLDGVRWQDFYQARNNFPYIWLKYAKDLTFYGMPESDATMETASVPVSLPSYQSMSTGTVQPCTNNECSRVKTETFPEALVRKLKLDKKDVATFSSWGIMQSAVESVEGTTYTSLGNIPVVDPDTNLPDNVMVELNAIQKFDDAGGGDRLDPYTLSQALHYFQVYKPRFMWISLAVSDTAAHMGDIGLYGALLRYYDESFNRLFELLKAEGIDQETMVIVTTDHGRGDGVNWTSHGPAFPESKRTWAFVYHGELKPISINENVKHYNTLSIRPTIEEALGL